MHSTDNDMPGYCAKDNSEVAMSQGCKHPNDFCQHRTSCILHFMEKERERETRRDSGSGQVKEEDQERGS